MDRNVNIPREFREAYNSAIMLERERWGGIVDGEPNKLRCGKHTNEVCLGRSDSLVSGMSETIKNVFINSARFSFDDESIRPSLELKFGVRGEINPIFNINNMEQIVSFFSDHQIYSPSVNPLELNGQVKDLMFKVHANNFPSIINKNPIIGITYSLF